jgi:hypothetical protein
VKRPEHSISKVPDESDQPASGNPDAAAAGGQPQFQGQPESLAYYNVVAPTDASKWTLELLVQFLFPK